MIKLYRALSITVIFLLFASVSLAQIGDVIISSERLSERVYVIWGGELYKDQVVAIKSTKGIILIDTGKSPTLTEQYRESIEVAFQSTHFIYAINTHYHFDHTSGNQVFPEATIIAHEKTPAMLKKWADTRQAFIHKRRGNQMVRWQKQKENAAPDSEDWIRFNDYLTTGKVMLDDYKKNYKLTLPDITFKDEMQLELGDLSLELFYFGEGLHTGDDILILCPEEKILFSGDLFFKGSYGFAFKPDIAIERWIIVLDELFENNEIEWVYDCHNGRMSGAYIDLYRRYMKDVYESLLTAQKKKMSFEEMAEAYSYVNHFSYIADSGLDEKILLKGHAGNLKHTWDHIRRSSESIDK